MTADPPKYRKLTAVAAVDNPLKPTAVTLYEPGDGVRTHWLTVDADATVNVEAMR